MNADGVRRLIAKQVEEHGSQAELARQAGITSAYVSQVMLGKATPGNKFLAWLGLEKVVSYQKAR